MRMGTGLVGPNTSGSSKQHSLQAAGVAAAGLQMPAANLLTDRTPPSLVEVREAVRRLMDGKAAGVCIISEMWKIWSEAMVNGVACNAVCCVAVKCNFS